MIPLIHIATDMRPTTRQYLQPGEQEVLLTLIKSVAPKTMVEIGVNIGLTARAMLRHIPSIEHYVGIDVDVDYRFEIPAQQTEHPDEPGRLVKDDPRFELRLRGRHMMPTEADAVFIDGDHGMRAVMADSKWAAEVVRPGGIIVWHDYGNPTVEVTEVLDWLRGEGRRIMHVAGTWLAFEHR